MRKLMIPLLLSLAALSAGGAFAAAKAPKAQPEKIAFTADRIISPYFIGAGVQWSAYPHADSDDALWGPLMTDAKWDTVCNRLAYMQPRFMRVMDQANWRYFKRLDENGEPVLEFDNQRIRSLFRILDFCQRNGVVVQIGDWGVPGHRHDKDKPEIRLRDAADTRWHSMIGEWVDFLINKKGYTCIKYYELINEPNGAWACTAGNFPEWVSGVTMLHREFERRGLTDKISMIGPGSVPNADVPALKDRWRGYLWTDYAAATVDGILGAYNTHAYYPHLAVRGGKAAEYMFFAKDVPIAHDRGKPFILGEIGLKATKDGGELAAEHERRRVAKGNASIDSNMFIYDYFYGLDMASAAIQSINAGVDACAAWDVDDAMHTKDDLGNPKDIKRWGFWNILGTELFDDPADENIRPWYWAWSWLCRYLPPRSEVYSVPAPAAEGCQLLVAKAGDGYTVCAVNTSDKDAAFELNCPQIPPLTNVNRLVYNEQYADRAKPYDVRTVKKFDMAKGALLELPAKTFTVLTTLPL